VAKKDYQALPGQEKQTAKALLRNAQISLKYSTELCNLIRGQPVNKTMEYLEKIRTHEDYLPLKMYHKKVGHRKGDAQRGTKSGRYPERVCVEFLNLLRLVKANAEYKGLDSEKLIILTAFASMGFSRYSYQSKGKIAGKARRRNSTHLEIVVMESK
jgi:large subunit ribosomal protein L22